MIAINAKSGETIRTVLASAGECIKLHQYDDAIHLLSEFLKVNKAVPDIYNARGYAYEQQGDLDRAEEDLAEVVRLAPQFPGAEERLRLIRRQLELRKK